MEPFKFEQFGDKHRLPIVKHDARRRYSKESAAVRLAMSIDTVGGGWSPVLQLARSLAGEGFDVSLGLLGPEASPSRNAQLQAAGLPAIAAHQVAARHAAGFRDMQEAGQALARLSNVLAVDAVILHHPALAGFGPFEAPVIVTPDGRDAVIAARASPGQGNEWRTRLLRSGYQAAAGVVAPTHADARDILEAHRLRLPPRVIRRAWPTFESEAPAVDLAPYALAAHANTDGRENIPMLNEAAFLSRTPLMLAGARAGALAETGHLWALGELAPGQFQRWLAGAGVFVSATTGDTDGEAVWRAADAGCALALADSPDYRELWDGAAVFVEPGDDRALARAIDALMADEDGRRKLGAAAQARAHGFTLQQAAADWASFIRAIATHARSATRAA